jgi:hypothetical protein
MKPGDLVKTKLAGLVFADENSSVNIPKGSIGLILDRVYSLPESADTGLKFSILINCMTIEHYADGLELVDETR